MSELQNSGVATFFLFYAVVFDALPNTLIQLFKGTKPVISVGDKLRNPIMLGNVEVSKKVCSNKLLCAAAVQPTSCLQSAAAAEQSTSGFLIAAAAAQLTPSLLTAAAVEQPTPGLQSSAAAEQPTSGLQSAAAAQSM
ncbi:hypothetical protein ATANTOWER_019144 [Ataeniobius toweri]|uniref:Uncharacterized protein n=1 Tax=Ataeniobius toweri TaxID=208326 RepID=A0ABU7AQ03_9TELE|nr:hypothetical protein [Ataeniobius toweri]